MKSMLFFFMMSGTIVASAQSNSVYLPYSVGQLQQQARLGIPIASDSLPAKKWFFSKSVGLSSSISFFNGGRASIVSVPVGLQLNRKLHDNWYAFAGVAVAPTYINFNALHQVNNSKFGRPSNMLQPNRFDLFSRAEMGLMYVNDQKTFSISGSIGVERSSYPFMPYNSVNPIRPGASNVFNR